MNVSSVSRPFLASLVAISTAPAAIVNLTPGQINGLDTSTSNFDNGEVSLTPYVGTTTSTFNANNDRLGIDGQGTNNNAFNDPDRIADNGNEEKLEIAFQPTSGLTQISWDFSRADGPGAGDGVFISGFLSDPGASLDGGTAVDSSLVSYDSGILEIDIAGADFGDPDGFLNLANAAASAGQTLLITTTDTTQAGAQFAITGLQYDNEAIPEPSSLMLTLIAGLGLLRRRR